VIAQRQRALHASKFLALVIAVALQCALVPVRSAERYSEAAVKAAFIHRFAGYVEWPGAGTPRRLRIAVMGDAEVARHLGALLARQAAGGRQPELVVATRASDLGSAQIVFVGAEAREPRTLISAVAARPILIVTDHEKGLELGAAVNFLVVDQRVRFEVSMTAAESAGLRISSDMLSVAVRVLGARRARVQAGDAGQ